MLALLGVSTFPVVFPGGIQVQLQSKDPLVDSGKGGADVAQALLISSEAPSV